MEHRVSEPQVEIVDPFAIAAKKKVSYGSFASMSTSEQCRLKACGGDLWNDPARCAQSLCGVFPISLWNVSALPLTPIPGLCFTPFAGTSSVECVSYPSFLCFYWLELCCDPLVLGFPLAQICILVCWRH